MEVHGCNTVITHPVMSPRKTSIGYQAIRVGLFDEANMHRELLLRLCKVLLIRPLHCSVGCTQ